MLIEIPAIEFKLTRGNATVHLILLKPELKCNPTFIEFFTD